MLRKKRKEIEKKENKEYLNWLIEQDEIEKQVKKESEKRDLEARKEIQKMQLI